MSTRTENKLKINGGLVSATLEINKTCFSPGEMLVATASFSQKGKNLGHFIPSECVIATPVGGPLEIFDIKETSVPSHIDPKLSSKCEKTSTYFFISMGNAIVQASGVFVSQDSSRHYIATDPLVIKMRKPGYGKKRESKSI